MFVILSILDKKLALMTVLEVSKEDQITSMQRRLFILSQSSNKQFQNYYSTNHALELTYFEQNKQF